MRRRWPSYRTTHKVGLCGNFDITYSDCQALEFLRGANYDLTRNGLVSLHIGSIDGNQGHATFIQNISYIGELGLFAQCNYTIVAQSAEWVNYSGQCFYTDSDGSEFPFSAKDMESVI